MANWVGSLTAQTGYDAFGNATNAAFPSRYQFTGRELDDFTGLMHYRARHYDPKLGRFISEDPIGFGGGDVNLYGYVRNQPYIFRDPMGLYPGVDVMANPNIWGPAAAGLAAAGGAILSAAGAAASSPAVVAGVGFGAGYAIGYYPGQWTANHPSNPFVNGPWNPWGTPAPMLPPFPITPPNSSPASRPYCQPAPRAVPYPNWPADKYPIPLGPYPPQTPEKQEECFNKCAHLLGIGKGAEYVTCYRRCMGTFD